MLPQVSQTVFQMCRGCGYYCSAGRAAGDTWSTLRQGRDTGLPALDPSRAPPPVTSAAEEVCRSDAGFRSE